MHYHFSKGKRVIVMKKDGESFVAKWRRSEGKYFYFQDREEIRICKVRFIAIYKPRREIVIR